MFDALGQIVKLTLAQEVVIPGGQEGRLTQMIRRELVLERKFDGVAKLTIPDPPPTPTSANSWLTYRDPKDRFTMRFPQEYQAQPSEDPDTILLGHATPLGPDLISVSTRTLSQQNVDQLRSGRIAAWRADKINVADNQVSPSRKLPAADWDSRKWDVYRFDAVLPLGGSPSSPNSRAKLYFFGYMILTGRGPGFYVEATTPQEPPGNFYLQVEEVLKTIAISGEVGATTRAGAP